MQFCSSAYRALLMFMGSTNGLLHFVSDSWSGISQQLNYRSRNSLGTTTYIYETVGLKGPLRNSNTDNNNMQFTVQYVVYKYCIEFNFLFVFNEFIRHYKS